MVSPTSFVKQRDSPLLTRTPRSTLKRISWDDVVLDMLQWNKHDFCLSTMLVPDLLPMSAEVKKPGPSHSETRVHWSLSHAVIFWSNGVVD